MNTRTPTTDSARLGHIESQVSSVATSLEAFIKESSEFRTRTEKEQTQIWAAIRENGDNLRNAIEKLSTRGQISWGMIVSTGGFLLVVISMVAAVNNQLIQGQLEQLKVTDRASERQTDMRLEFQKELRIAEDRVRDAHDKFLLRICDENHEALKSKP